MANKEENNNNHIQRIGEKFNLELENIKQERINLGIDKTKTSTRVLTNLLIKHSSWRLIKNDMITHKLGGGKTDE